MNEQQIDVQQVFAYGKKIAEAKIAKLQRGLKYIESFEADVQQNQVLNEQISQPLHEQIKQKSYFIKQLAVFPTISEYWQMYQQMTDELTNQGVMKSYENGMLLYRQPDGRLSYYQFIEVTKGESDWPPGVLIIQPGHYPVHILAEVMLTDDIDADFLAMIPQASWVVAIEFVLGTFQMNVFNFKVRFVPQAAISPHCV